MENLKKALLKVKMKKHTFLESGMIGILQCYLVLRISRENKYFCKHHAGLDGPAPEGPGRLAELPEPKIR